MSTPPDRRYIAVAAPVPLFQALTYAIEGTDAQRVQPGYRVVVPFRNREAIGIVVGVDVPIEAGRDYRSVSLLPDTEPAVTPALLATCGWIADYYAAPLGMVVRGALPALLTGAARPSPAPRTRRFAVVARTLDSLLERDLFFARKRRQRDAYELLESLGGRAPVDHLERQIGVSRAVLNRLVRSGLARFEDEAAPRDPLAPRARLVPPDVEPTTRQRDAIAAISAGAPGDVFLLHGVTGSGKTLVYIESLRHALDAGRTAIVLVPEIALTPQTVDRFRAAFGDRVAVLHSMLSDGERLDAWRAIRGGDKRIVVGARSAIFAPLERVGIIVVDEEHEPSYKQGETPRYHARDASIIRARHEGAVVVLGSATPSLESWANAERGRYRRLSLPERVGGGALPRVEVVDLRQKTAAKSREGTLLRRVISEPLEHALAASLARHEQSILLLNRRGYAAFKQCAHCGDVVSCPNCSISLTFHRIPDRMICHYCGHSEAPSDACRRCGQVTVLERGFGTQQVERVLVERFPQARIARMDVDSTSGRWSHQRILDSVGKGEIDILLGTQMIAKGLDFPNVTVVGVVDADVGMNLPDFRAAERSFQLMAQVAGRAGRGPKGGAVFIQTRLPDHHAVRCAVRHDYEEFTRIELADRMAPAYPPSSRLANVVFSSTGEQDSADLAERGAEWLRGLLARRPGLEITVLGPAPCPIERIKTRWRWHLLLKSPPPPASPRALTQVAGYFVRRFRMPRGLRGEPRVIVDRDPVSLL